VRSQPLAAACSRRPFQACLFAISAYFLAAGAIGLYRFRGQDSFDAAAVRLRAVGLRDASLPPSAGRVAAFGLLRDGCRLPLPPEAIRLAGRGNESESGVLAVARAEAARGADGYFFVTLSGPGDGTDPVRWVLEAVADGAGVGDAVDGSGWRAVGASGWGRPGHPWTSVAAETYPGITYPTPAGGGMKVSVDQGLGWREAVEWGLLNLMNVASFAGSAALGACGRGRKVRATIVAALMSHWAVRVVEGAALMLDGSPSAARAGAAVWLAVMPVLHDWLAGIG
jgi:hypothetical protein